MKPPLKYYRPVNPKEFLNKESFREYDNDYDQDQKCLNCGEVFKVTDFKVTFINGENIICCKNAPTCGGTQIDWVSPMFEIEEKPQNQKK